MNERPTWADLMKFELRKNPIIFDCGGYQGQWAGLARHYYPDSTIYVFEPVKQFYNDIVALHSNDKNIKVFNFAVSAKTGKSTINMSADGSSMHSQSPHTEEIETKDILEFLFENQIARVDLIKINIEGEEYPLLEYLVDTDELTMFENFCIQFHRFVPDYEERRKNIIEKAKAFYNRTINYEMIFECWSLKKLSKISCVGDSHISIFSNYPSLAPVGGVVEYENFSIFRIGPILAYSLPNKIDMIYDIIKSIGNSNVILSFGEIDCRAQILRIAAETGRHADDVIDNVVEHMFKSLEVLKDYNLILQSIAPEIVENPHHYYYKDHPEDFDAPQGTMQDRIEIKDKFQNKVKIECKNRGIDFLNIYDIIKNSDRKSFYFLDDIHLKSDATLYLVKKKLIELGYCDEENISYGW
jgi:FkbM family methyltransferase